MPPLPVRQNKAFLAEIRRRAAEEVSRKFLPVPYYRIRQNLAFSLPVTQFPSHCSWVRDIPEYPYAIWVLWTLEERLSALGWAAEKNNDQAAQACAIRDLRAFCQWQAYRHLHLPDLCLAHSARILSMGLGWKWVSRPLATQLRSTLRRLVDDGLAALPPLKARTIADFFAEGASLANIPVIGLLGLSRAASLIKHPEAESLSARAQLTATAWLENGLQGQVEGVSYDGYTADFLLDWIASHPLDTTLRDHPRMEEIYQEIVSLGAPKAVQNSAPLGDVEPMEMRFAFSFLIKWQSARGEPVKGLPTDPWSFVRGEALPLLAQSAIASRAPKVARLTDAAYALVLNASSPAMRCAIAWHRSRMGHMQLDSGSLVLSLGDDWIISDPGYQQYLRTKEREFSVGPSAHNQPLINGLHPDKKLTSRTYAVQEEPEAISLLLDLTPTYPEAAELTQVHRQVCLQQGAVTVMDRIAGAAITDVTYHWHGHPEAFWEIRDHTAHLWLHDRCLRISCQKNAIASTELVRLSGSRGHLTLQKSLHFAKPRRQVEIVWEFTLEA